MVLICFIIGDTHFDIWNRVVPIVHAKLLSSSLQIIRILWEGALKLCNHPMPHQSQFISFLPIGTHAFLFIQYFIIIIILMLK